MNPIEKDVENESDIDSQNTHKHTSQAKGIKNKFNVKYEKLPQDNIESTLKETPDENFMSKLKKSWGYLNESKKKN